MPKQPITQLLLNSKYKTCTHYIAFVTQAMSNGKRIMVWRSVCPPVSFFLTIKQCAAHTQFDSPGGSTRCGQCAFPFKGQTQTGYYC